jgi:hypothetical protein
MTPDTTLAEWLGFEFVFSALARLERGEGRADDLERLDGFWDLPDRLNAGFLAAGLGEFSRTARLFAERRGKSEGAAVRSVLVRRGFPPA